MVRSVIYTVNGNVKWQEHVPTNKNKDVPWPPGQSVSVDGHNAAAYPADPVPQSSQDADSQAEQSAPNAFAFVWRVFKTKNKCLFSTSVELNSAKYYQVVGVNSFIRYYFLHWTTKILTSCYTWK